MVAIGERILHQPVKQENTISIKIKTEVRKILRDHLTKNMVTSNEEINFIFSIGSITVLSSTGNRRLEKTLDLAQSNRGELEKVIQYYSQNEADSLKLKAARFLIMNMPGHYSFIGRNYENYCKASEKIIFSKTSMNKKVDKLNKLIRQYPAECFERVEDCSIITADYLYRT